jgi:hypothetical protein
MWQVELPVQVTLPPGATTGVQVELSVQSRVHEFRQAPPQLVWFPHEKRQVPASPPQAAAVREQLFPSLHEHVPPLQTGDGAVDDPQAARTRTRMASRARMHVGLPARVFECLRRAAARAVFLEVGTSVAVGGAVAIEAAAPTAGPIVGW